MRPSFQNVNRKFIIFTTDKTGTFTADTPENYQEASSKVIHEFYHKEIGNKAVTNAKSAMSMQTKRSILTAEMLRVLLRCSPLLDWDTTAKHASEMNKRMQHSGYNYNFTKQVTNAALNKYKNIVSR